MYTVEQLGALLTREGADFELIRQDAPILSAKDAEPYYDVTKAAPTLVLQSDRGLVACVLSANRGRLDLEAVKAAFGFEKLRMADRKKVQKQTGYEAGAIPLVGLDLDCIFDESLMAFDYVYGGTGDPLTTLKIAPGDVKRLNKIIGCL